MQTELTHHDEPSGAAKANEIAGNRRFVRRIEITLEREIVSVTRTTGGTGSEMETCTQCGQPIPAQPLPGGNYAAGGAPLALPQGKPETTGKATSKDEVK